MVHRCCYAEEGDDQKNDERLYPDIAADWMQVLPNHDDVDGSTRLPGRLLRPSNGRYSPLFSSTSVRKWATWAREPQVKTVQVCWSTCWPDSNPNAGTAINAVVRDALNLSAWYPSFSWDPSAGTMPISL